MGAAGAASVSSMLQASSHLSNLQSLEVCRGVKLQPALPEVPKSMQTQVGIANNQPSEGFIYSRGFIYEFRKL
jgi:hypothetical protein